jgi:hypothetical protein
MAGMQDQGYDRRTHAVEHGGHRLQVAEVDVERAQCRDDDEIRENEGPAAGPSTPKTAAQIGGVNADLDRERSRQRLADGDPLAHLLFRQPFAVGDELALHLPDQRHRPAEAEEPKTQEVDNQLADAAARRWYRDRHRLTPSC